jgi:hypothetical protein
MARNTKIVQETNVENVTETIEEKPSNQEGECESEIEEESESSSATESVDSVEESEEESDESEKMCNLIVFLSKYYHHDPVEMASVVDKYVKKNDKIESNLKAAVGKLVGESVKPKAKSTSSGSSSSSSESSTCVFKIATGKRAGEPCGAKCKEGTRCGKHVGKEEKGVKGVKEAKNVKPVKEVTGEKCKFVLTRARDGQKKGDLCGNINCATKSHKVVDVVEEPVYTLATTIPEPVRVAPESDLSDEDEDYFAEKVVEAKKAEKKAEKAAFVLTCPCVPKAGPNKDKVCGKERSGKHGDFCGPAHMKMMGK